MEPNPNKFPVLSYVLSRINPNIPLIGRISSFDSPPDDCDIERPPSVNPHEWPEPPLFEQMPQLRDPELISSMKSAVADVAQTRSVLQTLGDRPDHETVDNARLCLAEIEASLANQLQEIVLSPRPDGLDRLEWRAKQSEKEQECRSATEKAKSMYKAVIALEEMHDSYEKLLKDAEERLVKIYRSSEGKIGVEEDRTAEDDQVNEEVVGILQEAMGKGLERVELSGRQLRIIPEAFGRLHSLVVLNLSNNHLEGLPDSIAALGNLEELRVSSNILVSLPDSIGLLFKLKILDASGNKLTALPNSVSQCRSLVELDASYNKIAYLPTYIGFELVNLQRLCVHLNKLRSLPTSICEMRSLRHLDAHFNELRGLPDTIGRLTNLEFLDLSSNFSDLTELPDTIGDLINLKELNLSNNQIYALPVTFGRLKDLSKLNLDQNPLIDPPMEVVKNGIDFVKNYMSQRLHDVLQEEEDRRTREANTESSQGGGWLTRSTSWLNNFVSGVSESVGGLVGGAGGRSFKDPYLDQQL